MPKHIKKQFIYDLILKNQFVTTFHLDGNFLDFYTMFYPDGLYKTVAKNFIYHCRTLKLPFEELIEISCAINGCKWHKEYGIRQYKTFIVADRLMFKNRNYEG